MDNILSRRKMMLGAASCALSFGVSSTRQANAGPIADMLNYAMQGDYFTALVALIEWGFSIQADEEQDAKLKDISDKLTNVIEKQEQIIKMIADQRYVIREELERNRRINEVRNLVSLTYRFNITLSYDDEQRKILMPSILGDINSLTAKLGTYGIDEAPAYMGAIVLQNSALYAFNAPRRAFLTANAPHRLNLQAMLNGTGAGTLADYPSTDGRDTMKALLQEWLSGVERILNANQPSLPLKSTPRVSSEAQPQ